MGQTIVRLGATGLASASSAAYNGWLFAISDRPFRGSGEMADAHALGACVLIDVWVRLPPSPPFHF